MLTLTMVMTRLEAVRKRVRRLQPAHVERGVYAAVRDSAYEFSAGVMFPSRIDVALSRPDMERWERNPLVLATLTSAIELNLRRLHEGLRRPATEEYVPRVCILADGDVDPGAFRVEAF